MATPNGYRVKYNAYSICWVVAPHTGELVFQASSLNAAAVDFWRWWEKTGIKTVRASLQKNAILRDFSIYRFTLHKVGADGRMPVTVGMEAAYTWREGMPTPRPALMRRGPPQAVAASSAP